jgi:hypothetical protein
MPDSGWVVKKHYGRPVGRHANLLRSFGQTPSAIPPWPSGTPSISQQPRLLDDRRLQVDVERQARKQQERVIAVVSGRTYENRQEIKACGCKWDEQNKVWLLIGLPDDNELRQRAIGLRRFQGVRVNFVFELPT